ncbi:FKBP-type peptidyl-prolyl cis-trans isomerase [Hyphobacterium sp. HN65]|uniref:Peptidyl-prolyl cis-trans isomerase n=1 Tax=Hyphobacterium lacteum TaxID=3116575 RepID=A0ABU7LP08_9PROT|nr:FKBP-type peptidyl-prolyl cis-trans isomerase [Hyphobacterium sp. HN65]MEE2525649.1 FKBP-type peptidyl-prolyl cis-trans isomerase [Hyphobacterium sp. HN65]
MRALVLTGILTLSACSSAPATRPMPEDPDDALSVVAAARQCHVEDFADEPMLDVGQPEFGGNPTQAQRNEVYGALFIERMSLQPCVYELPSGLNFRILRAAGEEGLTPEGGELVRVHYDGQDIHGQTFDSSYERGAPAEFPSGRLIAGWVEALGLMRTGEEWELFIPPDLAYGERGTPGGPIGPSETLYFRMELICLPSREEGGCAD